MKNSRTLALFGMIACCVLVASVRTNAQSVTGFTDLSYDDLTNTVIAYSAPADLREPAPVQRARCRNAIVRSLKFTPSAPRQLNARI
jgi:hypothetical protein